MFHPTSDKRSRAAFTLIELLVVIAIIAILAAILFPVFAQAREKARQTSCLSNQKQLALGALMYAQDFDETLPSAQGVYQGQWQYLSYYDTPANWETEDPDWVNCMSSVWANQIYAYIKNSGIYSC